MQYGWEVRRIERAAQGDDSQIFTLRLGLTGSHSDEDSEGASGTTLTCTRLLYATGATTPNVPRGSIEGLEKYSIGYEDAPIDPEYYAGKRVAILGNGNSAFETANNIFSRAAYVHIAGRMEASVAVVPREILTHSLFYFLCSPKGRSRVRLSWSTHYVGDVRAVNSHLLDNYQLKSIDLHFETGGRQMRLQPGMNGSIGLANAKRQKSLGSGGGGELSDEERQQMQKYEAEGYATLAGAYRHELEHSRNEYDVVIRCLGFVFDSSPFARSARPLRGIKYPNMTAEYESINVPGLFFVGSLQHAVDYRRSSGGFIHGFRYLIRALARTLDQRFHDTPWPRNAVGAGGGGGSLICSTGFQQLLVLSILKVAYENKAIGERIVQRMNEASAPYQMFGVLGDVVLLPVLDKSAAEASLLDSLPDCEYLQDVLMYANNTLLPADRPYITFSFEYGTNFSYPGADTFHAKRVTTKVVCERKGRDGGGWWLKWVLTLPMLVPVGMMTQVSKAELSNFLHPVLRLYRRRGEVGCREGGGGLCVLRMTLLTMFCPLMWNIPFRSNSQPQWRGIFSRTVIRGSRTRSDTSARHWQQCRSSSTSTTSGGYSTGGLISEKTKIHWVDIAQPAIWA